MGGGIFVWFPRGAGRPRNVPSGWAGWRPPLREPRGGRAPREAFFAAAGARAARARRARGAEGATEGLKKLSRNLPERTGPRNAPVFRARKSCAAILSRRFGPGQAIISSHRDACAEARAGKWNKNEKILRVKMWSPKGPPKPGARRSPKRVSTHRGRPGARVTRAPAPPRGPSNGGEHISKTGARRRRKVRWPGAPMRLFDGRRWRPSRTAAEPDVPWIAGRRICGPGADRVRRRNLQEAPADRRDRSQQPCGAIEVAAAAKRRTPNEMWGP